MYNLDELEGYIKEKLQLLYILINREMFKSALPASVFILSNQGVKSKKRVKYQAIEYKDGEYCIKVSKAYLDKPNELIIFIVQQMIIIDAHIKKEIMIDKSRLDKSFLQVCEKYDVEVGGDSRTGYYIEAIDEDIIQKYERFVFDDEWTTAARLVINSGVVENGILKSRNMVYYICPNCLTFAKALKGTDISCCKCNEIFITTEEFIQKYKY